MRAPYYDLTHLLHGDMKNRQQLHPLNTAKQAPATNDQSPFFREEDMFHDDQRLG
jgi:hypothetical protein